MKDTTIAYDLVHQPQASWNQQRQHQTHTTSVYANHSTQQQLQQPNAQRSPIGQQNQQHAAQLGQYQHQQQLQSSAHHNTAAVAAAYYQQAHMYPTYQTHAHSQDQQQHPSGSDHQQQQHHHHGSSVSVTGATSPAINAAAVAAAAQQQHAAVHHSQSANTQTSALNHTGWSPGVNSLNPQAHHAVVTDHSTLAYMTHAYQSHNSSVGDHHRNSNAPMSNQPIGTGPQASSYAVDSLYNTPAAAAAAAVAAYGYNNYNTAFFQSSNNGPHSQTSHPSSASLSGFWGHNQNQQQRNHSQSVSNQASLQQRQQQLAPDQAASYMHDPRLYYGRPNYTQGLQNFGQHHSQTQPQTDIVHHRLSTISQQAPLVQQHDQQMHQSSQQQSQHLHNQSPMINQHSQYNQATQHHTDSTESQLSPNQQVTTIGHSSQQGRKIQSIAPPAQSSQKKPSNEIDAAPSHNAKNSIDHEQVASSNQISHGNLPNHKAQQTQNQSGSNNVGNQSQLNAAQSESKEVEVQQLQPSTLADKKPQAIENSGHYQGLRKPASNAISQPAGRNSFRSSQDDRAKSRLNEPMKKTFDEKDQRLSSEQAEKLQAPPTKHHESESHNPTLEDSMASLAITTRKTTWASIASQPAKVSQPKSLKSKISGTNSVLSSAKHLTASSMDSSSLDSKNGINPAIKGSVSSAATTIQKSSVPPPITKSSTAVTASLKFDILGENPESTKISWPAVNASVNLRLSEPLIQKESAVNDSLEEQNTNERQKKDDAPKNRDYNDQSYKDHNHNQGSKMVNNYPSSHGRRDEFWYRRDNQRDHQRIRRDSDRKEPEYDKKPSMDQHSDQRDSMSAKRDVKIVNSRPNFRGDDMPYRDYHKPRGAMMDRNERGNDSYHNARFSQHRYEPPRDHQHGSRQSSNENAPHHHYNNVRDGNHSRNPPTKPDLNVHPHLNPANFNPKNFECEPENARFFIIKSYSEDDIHRSIKYSIWCSTNHGNRRLDEAYKQQQTKNGKLYLFFSVNGSGHFCGMAQMTSAVDFDSSSGVWAQSKWQGEFSVKWIYVKDVPNAALRHITLENNEDKPVTNSRDTQEVPSEKGKAVLKILHQYNHSTSIFDDFLHYERRQEEEKMKKSSHLEHLPAPRSDDNRGGNNRFNNRPYVNARSHNEFHGNRDRMSRFAS